jgi:hypothetical protein
VRVNATAPPAAIASAPIIVINLIALGRLRMALLTDHAWCARGVRCRQTSLAGKSL